MNERDAHAYDYEKQDAEEQDHDPGAARSQRTPRRWRLNWSMRPLTVRRAAVGSVRLSGCRLAGGSVMR